MSCVEYVLISSHLIDFSSRVRSEFIIDVIHTTQLAQSKRNCINEIVSSRLFRFPDCRAILLPIFCQEIRDKLTRNNEVCDR